MDYLAYQKCIDQAHLFLILFFVDDALIFCKSSLAEVECLKSVLQEYEIVSGQTVNFTKSSIFYGYNTIVANKDVI